MIFLPKTLQWSPTTALSSQPPKKFHRVSAIWMAKGISRRNDGACRNALLEGFSGRIDPRGVDRINNNIKLLPVGCAGHSVMGFLGENFVDIGVDMGLASLKAASSWPTQPNSKFVLAGADVFLDVFFGRHRRRRSSFYCSSDPWAGSESHYSPNKIKLHEMNASVN